MLIFKKNLRKQNITQSSTCSVEKVKTLDNPKNQKSPKKSFNENEKTTFHEKAGKSTVCKERFNKKVEKLTSDR